MTHAVSFGDIAALKLPAWEDIPDLDLYRDQVLTYVIEHYRPFTMTHGRKEKILTGSMINNYVKKKVMPAPEQKRYGRIHVAYLFLILTAKSEIQLSDIPVLVRKLEAEWAPEDEATGTEPMADDRVVARVYSLFRKIFDQASRYIFMEHGEREQQVHELVSGGPATRTLFWVCLTACARLRTTYQMCSLTAQDEPSGD